MSINVRVDKYFDEDNAVDVYTIRVVVDLDGGEKMEFTTRHNPNEDMNVWRLNGGSAEERASRVRLALGISDLPVECEPLPQVPEDGATPLYVRSWRLPATISRKSIRLIRGIVCIERVKQRRLSLRGRTQSG